MTYSRPHLFIKTTHHTPPPPPRATTYHHHRHWNQQGTKIKYSFVRVPNFSAETAPEKLRFSFFFD
jgi:hypothetical protein